MKNTVIAGYARSPFTLANKGELSLVRPDEMAAQVVKSLIDNLNIDSKEIEDLIVGCAFPEGEQGLNVARLISFLAKMPNSVAAQTINRFCGSSMQSVHIATGNIAIGAGECFIAAGVESMSRIPMAGFNPSPHPELFENYPQAYESMGVTAENLAKRYSISKEKQEKFAVESHQKAFKAQQEGKFKDEIRSIENGEQIISEDGCIRGDSNIEKLATLTPAFDEAGTVTAGTSSPLTDGAVALLVCSEDYAKQNNLDIMARVKSVAVSGCAPEIMGIGPVEASKKALSRAGLSLNDIDIIELNEAFAAQSLAVIEELEIPQEKLNIDGGAIALGHPLGASGARIVGKASSLLKRENKQLALATMCIGGGQGIATILEKV